MKRIRRLKVSNGIYHCMSRLVPWAPVLDGVAKRVFVAQMRRQEAFCGVEVVTYCVMGNHFHILVRVPAVVSGEVTNAELVRRFRVLYRGAGKNQLLTAEVLEKVLADGGDEAERLRKELLARMHDVSVFIKELKQRFSFWYNGRYESRGTIWSERFKSVLVEGRPWALKTVAAYIDLNPVRAGLVGDPKDYSWSGYGAACGGSSLARLGLARALGGHGGSSAALRRALAAYRVMLYGKGAVAGLGGKRFCLDPAVARRVLERGGKLSPGEVLLCRMQAMREGIIFGSHEFVDGLAEFYRQAFGRKRRRSPVLVEGLQDKGLCVLKG